MASTAGPPKRHRDKRLGERRRDAGSSRDASEEDNEEDVSDVGSLMSVHATASTPSSVASPRVAPPPNLPIHAAITSANLFPGQPFRRGARRVDELSGEGSQSEGLDSPTYDGDIESSSTVGGTPVHSHFHPSHATHMRHPSSPTAASSTTHPHSSLSPYGRLPTPKASRANLHDAATPPAIPTSTSFPASADTYTSARTGTGFGAALLETRPSDVPVQESEALSPPRKSQTMPLSTKSSMSAMGPTKMYSRPVELSLEDIRGFVQRAIEGRGEEDGVERWWKTSPPPEGRPVRIYADGVYDLFHFGHALQLRQAKLSFPSVHLLVGVCSDKLCAEHKSAPAMTHAERCESIRHCRWADEVLPDAPWVVDQAWLDKHQIDYIAHDELVYPSKDLEDVYAFAKRTGKFVPTRRTPAISTSDLLERIVRGYRDGFFDSKLEKNGLPELLAADVDWDSSASIEKREKRKKRAQEKAQAQARELAQEQK